MLQHNGGKMKVGSTRRGQSGFTLVEIAIVLVIIGLLLGGILKGQEMITQAKIKNVVNDFNGITAAVNSYQDRYRALPGDDLNAATRWTGSVSGNGNGQLLGTYNNVLAAAATAAQETNTFWWHLRLSGFVAGPTAGTAAGQQPGNAVNGIMGVQTGAGATTLGFASTIICTSNLPDKITIAVETQMDDGTYNTGQIRGIKQAAPNPDLRTQVAGDTYVEDGSSQWTVCKNM
jgi:prepilin-type N-terminal cleavage/methylation domain-containing protein